MNTENNNTFTLEDMYMLAAKVADDIAANRMNLDWNLNTTPKMIVDAFIKDGHQFKGEFYKPSNNSIPETGVSADWDLYPGNEAGAFDHLD